MRPAFSVNKGIAVAVVLVLASVAAAAADVSAPTDLIRRMTAATKNLDYDGVFIYQRGTQIDAMRIVHKFVEGAEKERLIFLSGPDREVIRDGSRVTCIFADDREVMVEKSEPRSFLSLDVSGPIERLHKSYEFTNAGRDRVAGRDTLVLTVVPKEPNRYGYRLWIDEDFDLLLKSVILGINGQPLEQVQFVNIDISVALPDGLFEAGIEGAGFTWHTNSESAESAANVVETSGWSVNWLPSGFQMDNHKVQSISESEMPVSHMVYSDGLAMVSVFVEELTDSSQRMQGYSSMGAINAFSQVTNSHQITVVGEVPSPTVRHIAASVTHRQNR